VQWQKWLVLILAALLLYLARRILPPFIIAGVIAYVLSPLVDLLAARGVPHRAAAVVVFLAFLTPLIVAGALLRPVLRTETRELLANGPQLIENVLVQATGGQPIEVFGARVAPRTVAVQITDSVRAALGRPSDAFHAAEQALDVVLNVLLTLLAILYFLMDGRRLGHYILRFIPLEQRAHVAIVAPRIHHTLGRYLGGQAMLVALMATVTFLVLQFVFHLRFALALAIATGFLEVIPVLGPITAGAIACLVALGQDGVTQALWVALAYLILRQAEDQLIMPQVVGRVVHLHPLVTIFAVLAGSAIAGVLGMVLAVPAAASVKVIIDYAYPEPALLEPTPDAVAHEAAAATPLRSERAAVGGGRRG
jgi:predicted PurR-regulated permease PerM